ncbi:MAG: proline--tRNA ligase [Desulfurococcales archaeon]|nr:proline--tRNA ligase [Desulfurococcales archaeon]
MAEDRASFNKAVEEAGILFIEYPVSGVYPYLPFGARMFKKLQRMLEELLEETGHEPIAFPSLIPVSLFKREVDFFKGFSPEALLAERTLSGRELDEALILRPTSEVPIYYVYSHIIKSWRDLPLKVYQNVTVYRIETKATAPFFRLREVTGFSEEHAFARDEEEAARIFDDAVRIYSKFIDMLGIPYLVVESPPWDLFPGARRNWDFVTILPDGKLLELASVIDLAQKFARAFEIMYQDESGNNRYVNQVTYGIGLDRILGALLWLGMDKRGFVLHPLIAPIDVVVIPIYYSEEEKAQVMGYIEGRVLPLLREAGLRYYVDTRERTPGYKYYYWESRGIPFRVEVGRREASEGTVTLFRRDSLEKRTLQLDSLVDAIREASRDYAESLAARLREKAAALLKEHALILDVPFEREECLRIEEEREVTTIGRIVAVKGFDEGLVGKVLFGRKY